MIRREEKKTEKVAFFHWRFDLVPSPPFQFHVDGRFAQFVCVRWGFFFSLCSEKNAVFLVIHKIHTLTYAHARAQKKKFELEWHSVVDLTLCDRTKRMNNKRTVLLLLLSFALLIRLLSFSLVVCSEQKELQKITRLKEENISNMFFFVFHFISFGDTWKFNTTPTRGEEQRKNNTTK